MVPPRKALFITLQKIEASWPPSQSWTTIWEEGTLILDINWDLWVCTAEGNPGSWKKLSGGTGAVNFYAEDLTAQVDGITNTFNTNAGTPRQAGTIRVYLNGLDKGTPGTLVAGAEVEEISTTSFKLDLVPVVGEKLHVTYFG